MKKVLTAWAMVPACLAASPALADTTNGYGVSTSAVTGQYLDNVGGVATSVSAYRMGQDSSGNFTATGDVPPVSFDNCPAGSSICFASHSGTSGPGFNQASSTSNSGLLYNAGGGFGQSSASTYARLGTGKLGASGSTNYYQTSTTVARFNDTLTFHIAGADSSTLTKIFVKFRLDGSLVTPTADGAPSLGTPTAAIFDSFNFGAASAFVGFQQTAANSRYGTFSQTLTQTNGQSGWLDFSWDSISPEVTEFTGTYALSGASAVLGIGNTLRGDATTGGSFAYGNTSSLSFLLPGNVSFSSASGTFLSELPPITSGAPEPDTWAMMLIGFAVAGLALRRRDASSSAGRRIHAGGLPA